MKDIITQNVCFYFFLSCMFIMMIGLCIDTDAYKDEKQETIDSLTDKVESQERYINFLESQNDMLMNKEIIEKDIEEGLNEN